MEVGHKCVFLYVHTYIHLTHKYVWVSQLHFKKMRIWMWVVWLKQWLIFITNFAFKVHFFLIRFYLLISVHLFFLVRFTPGLYINLTVYITHTHIYMSVYYIQINIFIKFEVDGCKIICNIWTHGNQYSFLIFSFLKERTIQYWKEWFAFSWKEWYCSLIPCIFYCLQKKWITVIV